jgi:hypothetical protein
LPDLIVANGPFFGRGDVEVLEGTGNGYFQYGGKSFCGSYPNFVTVAQLAPNEPDDLIVADGGRGSHSAYAAVLLGEGNGQFGPPRFFLVGSRPSALVPGEFIKGKGRPDIAVSDGQTGEVVVVRQLQRGDFVRSQSLDVGFPAETICTGDFNNNGTLDLAVGGTTGVVVFQNTSGKFEKHQTIRLPGPTESLTAADLNGNGNLDFVAAIPSKGEVDALYGDGSGKFSEPRRFYVGFHPVAVTVADVNDDGIPDLITANQSGGDVAVLLGLRPKTV